jgi:hypothetical protein
MNNRLEIASRMLPELMRSGESQTYVDKDETIHYLVRLAYRYADKLLEFENTKLEDIENILPAVPGISQIIPGQRIRKVN